MFAHDGNQLSSFCLLVSSKSMDREMPSIASDVVSCGRKKYSHVLVQARQEFSDAAKCRIN
jgi:hypothetical protein